MSKANQITVYIATNKDLKYPLLDHALDEVVIVINDNIYTQSEKVKNPRIMTKAVPMYVINVYEDYYDPTEAPSPQFDGPHKHLMQKYGDVILGIYRIFLRTSTATQKSMQDVTGLEKLEIRAIRGYMLQTRMLEPSRNAQQSRTPEWHDWLIYYFEKGAGSGIAQDSPIQLSTPPTNSFDEMIADASQMLE